MVNGPKMGPKMDPKMDPKWTPNGTQNGPQIGQKMDPKCDPKWTPNGSQNDPLFNDLLLSDKFIPSRLQPKCNHEHFKFNLVYWNAQRNALKLDSHRNILNNGFITSAHTPNMKLILANTKGTNVPHEPEWSRFIIFH